MRTPSAASAVALLVLVRLTGLREPLRADRTCPVTFWFERGGRVTLQLGIGAPTPVPPG